jgi:hypothetical protein
MDIEDILDETPEWDKMFLDFIYKDLMDDIPYEGVNIKTIVNQSFPEPHSRFSPVKAHYEGDAFWDTWVSVRDHHQPDCYDKPDWIYEKVDELGIELMVGLANEYGWDIYEDKNPRQIRCMMTSLIWEGVMDYCMRNYLDDIREEDTNSIRKIQKVFRGQAVRNRIPCFSWGKDD